MTSSQVGVREAPAATAPGALSSPSPARRRSTWPIVVGAVAALLALAALSLSVGAGEVGAARVLDYLLNRDGARADGRLALVVGDLRLPRTLTALLVGAALGVAGAQLQSVTRNPLAETGLLG